MCSLQQAAQLGPPRAQLAGDLQAGQAWHRDVENRQVDVLAQADRERLEPVGCLGRDLQVGLAVEHEPQPAPDDGVVVGEQDAGPQLCHESDCSGSESRTSVPCPGRLRMST